MSTDEKDLQLAAAVKEYQAAKVESAHVETKLQRVYAAYREVGRTTERGSVDTLGPRIVKGRVVFGYAPEPKISPADLMNEFELAELLEERELTKNRVVEAKTAMEGMGLTAIA